MAIKIKILLIEDDQDDIEFLKVALDDNKVNYSLETLTRGDQIVNRMEDVQHLPDIIIMDLNLPKLHGREVMCKIKEHPIFQYIPLLVLTTSSSNTDKDYCLSKGADIFISKPATTEGFEELVQTIRKMSMQGQKRLH